MEREEAQILTFSPFTDKLGMIQSSNASLNSFSLHRKNTLSGREMMGMIECLDRSCNSLIGVI